MLFGVLSGMSSDILSGILSGISSGISSDILSGILSGKSSGILSGKHSGILSGISSGILSDMLSGVHRWASTWDLPSSVCTAGPQPGTFPAQCAPLDLNLGPAQLSVHRWTSTHTELGRSQVEVQRCTLSWEGPRLRSSSAHLGKLKEEAEEAEEEEAAEDEEEDNSSEKI